MQNSASAKQCQRGAGTAAIVLLPGMDGTGKLFAAFTAVLGDRYTPLVIAYPADGPQTYRELEAFVRDRLPQDRPFILLGESFSGPIAISLAASKPAGLAGLVLCCTFARNPVRLPSSFSGLLKTLVALLPLTPRLAGLAFSLLLGRFCTGRLRTALGEALACTSPRVLRARLRAVIDVDVSDQLTNIEVPVLYLRASADHVVPRSASRHLQSLRPQMEIVTLQAPHFLLQAVPAEAAAAVLDFAGRLAPLADSSKQSGA